ncbi:hypothetical protein N7456_002234 [Penicillium angulare]|uniref:Zn(2)-C6 fungal-type domain-containing protein n=1 Tax=Penicillium angulare TaxID=116970 RepID=A0A9W9KPM8_9EURO|nr:hypothetical protein N7456_002234 [Penicillium angulare]
MRARTGRYQACDRCRKLHRRCHRSPGKDTCQALAQFSFDKVSPPSIPSEETSLVYRDEIRLNESFSGRNYSKTPEHINGDNILNPSTQGVYDEIVPDFSNSPGNESDRVTSPIGNGIGSLNSWSLQSELEASLLIYFLTTLSPWFDYCDQTQPYRNYIANHAATDMTLLYAVLAVSARHQSSTGQKLSQLADEYQRHCLKRLIPALSDPSTTSGDAVLASATVLRFFEEMTGKCFT